MLFADSMLRMDFEPTLFSYQRQAFPDPYAGSCGGTTRGGRFLPGHDARLHAELKRNLVKDPLLRNERFTDEQRRYAVERGLAGHEVLPEEEQRDG